ncbi:MAG: hypothetical protein GJU72_14485 [Acidithiobacillus ferriphilus]|jgi:hypothetical protein|uniref:hypothetical protein n=1 Tax=Acidithiobacillus ferriphilus TaxID=1689834 RepID=UPI0024302098|nr:hypothetical protein [Acidithiobacillus ferriphilus]MBW9250228.1 hypothetical protein [Acidithiobacillus ferriphilus]MBW9255336.1 hypothetical protein [Acidithiobacillus ferriphilus]
MANKETGNIHPLPPGPGRPKGSPNKITGNVKSMILGALDDLGGQAWLVEQAKADPRAFMSLLGRILPSEISLDAHVTHDPIVEIRRTIIDPRIVEQEQTP